MKSVARSRGFLLELVISSAMKAWLAKCWAHFKKSAETSRRTDRLFAVGCILFAIVPGWGFRHLPDWLFWTCVLTAMTCTFAGVISLALDNRQTGKRKYGP